MLKLNFILGCCSRNDTESINSLFYQYFVVEHLTAFFALIWHICVIILYVLYEHCIFIHPFQISSNQIFVFKFWFLQPFLFQSLKVQIFLFLQTCFVPAHLYFTFLVSSNLFCSNSFVLDYPPPLSLFVTL